MRNQHSPRAAADMNEAAGNAGERALPRPPAPAATEADQILIDSGWCLPAADTSKRRRRHG